MRLPTVERGQGLKQRFIFAMIRMMSGQRAPDVVRTILYRGEMFGQPFSAMVQATLRGPSDWSVGERELFAAFASRLNECEF
jgi:hypothetical protein